MPALLSSWVQRNYMKLLLVGLFLVALTCSLPEVEQMLLANSMVVGRENENDLVNWECNVCAPANKPLHAHYIEQKQKDVKCVLSVYTTFVSLAFRYTNTAQNIWQDILYASQVVDKNVCSNCKVQKAYKNMWNTIRDDVLDDLREIQEQTGLKRLFITGISLGGGLSLISYIDVRNSEIFEQVEVISFGAPRVANKNYANNFDALTNGKSIRYIVKGDPIVVMPECLTTLICNYKHTGVQYVCVEDTKQCSGCTPVPETVFGLMKWRREADASQRNLSSILDHIYGYKKIYNHTIVEC